MTSSQALQARRDQQTVSFFSGLPTVALIQSYHHPLPMVSIHAVSKLSMQIMSTSRTPPRLRRRGFSRSRAPTVGTHLSLGLTWTNPHLMVLFVRTAY